MDIGDIDLDAEEGEDDSDDAADDDDDDSALDAAVNSIKKKSNDL